ncbi:DUF6476 family protein [Oceanomicrobium pacificus]|uniref:Uncharacterized protein n=1 Tax=Oceanomicrobium pacificus TaxID=2692916 RepID=A0A6B0TUH4_9RHOB|nr:DUF6476 family protein [Oceanomicrobium pacificus]MXU65248.1 hypothetical protein [Oceanomicrobium pacificus]
MDQPDQQAEGAEPPRLRALRWLVTALTATLIVGITVIMAIIVMAFLRTQETAAPSLPDSIVLPEGTSAGAVTFGSDWIAVVTRDEAGRETIRIFDADSGAERQSVIIGTGAAGN